MNKKLHTKILEYLEIFKTTASSDAVADFLAITKSDMFLCHFGLGLYIRNNYLLHESELRQLFIADGISHPDDMSSVIIQIWHEAINEDYAE